MSDEGQQKKTINDVEKEKAERVKHKVKPARPDFNSTTSGGGSWLTLKCFAPRAPMKT